MALNLGLKYKYMTKSTAFTNEEFIPHRVILKTQWYITIQRP